MTWFTIVIAFFVSILSPTPEAPPQVAVVATIQSISTSTQATSSLPVTPIQVTQPTSTQPVVSTTTEEVIVVPTVAPSQPVQLPPIVIQVPIQTTTAPTPTAIVQEAPVTAPKVMPSFIEPVSFTKQEDGRMKIAFTTSVDTTAIFKVSGSKSSVQNATPQYEWTTATTTHEYIFDQFSGIKFFEVEVMDQEGNRILGQGPLIPQ